MKSLASKSLRGGIDADSLSGGLRWLTDPRVVLVNEQYGAYKLTTLGALGAQSMLPLELTAGFGRLIRNLIDARLMPMIGTLSPVDLLALAYVVLRPKMAVNWSNQLPVNLAAYFESTSPSLLFSTFAGGETGRSKAIQLVNAVVKERVCSDIEAYKLLCKAYGTAAIVSSIANGLKVDRIKRMWSAKDLEGIRERLRDDALFYLIGFKHLMEVRAFYYHLKSRGITPEEVEQFEDSLQNLQAATLKFTTLVAYSSQLGPLVARVRGSKASGVTTCLGISTLRKLEAICGSDIDQLRNMSIDELVSHGIRRPVAVRLMEILRSE